MADTTVTSREVGIDVLVDSMEGEERHRKEIAYEFSNGRQFKDLGEDSTLYDPFPE